VREAFDARINGLTLLGYFVLPLRRAVVHNGICLALIVPNATAL
jgi:hypothetical protein